MTQSKRQARRAWAAAQRKHIKRGNIFHVEFQHDPGCAIYTTARFCTCDPHRVLKDDRGRVLKDDRGRVLARVEGAGEFDRLELVEGAI